MSDWNARARVTVGDVAEVVMGQSPPAQTMNDAGEGFPFLQGNAEFTDLHPKARQWCKTPLRIAAIGDVLLSVRAPVGALNVADQDYCIGRGLAAIRFTLLDNAFGFHALQKYVPGLQRVAQGTTFEAVRVNEVRELAIYRPEESEQRRIAQILDTVDETIRKTEQVIAKLKRMKRGLVHDLLTRGIDENGELRDPERNPETFQESDWGPVPKCWIIEPIGRFCSTFAGGTPSRNTAGMFGGIIPWVKSTEVHQWAIRSTGESLTEFGRQAAGIQLVPAGTPLIAMYGATAGVVGWLEIEAATNQAVLAAVPTSKNVNARWLFWALRFSAPVLLASVQGSGQPNLSKGIIDCVALARPRSKEEQLRISEMLDGHMELVQVEETRLAKLHTLKQGLMDDLLTGRVRAPMNKESDSPVG